MANSESRMEETTVVAGTRPEWGKTYVTGNTVIDAVIQHHR
jgi:hypothetical protein